MVFSGRAGGSVQRNRAKGDGNGRQLPPTSGRRLGVRLPLLFPICNLTRRTACLYGIYAGRRIPAILSAMSGGANDAAQAHRARRRVGHHLFQVPQLLKSGSLQPAAPSAAAALGIGRCQIQQRAPALKTGQHARRCGPTADSPRCWPKRSPVRGNAVRSAIGQAKRKRPPTEAASNLASVCQALSWPLRKGGAGRVRPD